MCVCAYVHGIGGQLYISMYLNKHAGIYLMQEVGKGLTSTGTVG